MKTKVVGIATGSHDIEVWHFESHNEICKMFCEHLARNTYKNVIVIEGEVIGTYKTQEPLIDFIPFEERFKEMAKTAKLPSTYSGEYIDDKKDAK